MASDPDTVTEAMIVRWMRGAIMLALALGVLTIALGYMDVRITDMDYRERVERAGSDELTVFIVVLLLPAGWVYRRPRWPQLVMWIMWLSSWAMLGVILIIGSGPNVAYEALDPVWLRPLLLVMTAGIVFIVLVALPVIRSRFKSPPLPKPTKLPSARVVER